MKTFSSKLPWATKPERKCCKLILKIFIFVENDFLKITSHHNIRVEILKRIQKNFTFSKPDTALKLGYKKRRLYLGKKQGDNYENVFLKITSDKQIPSKMLSSDSENFRFFRKRVLENHLAHPNHGGNVVKRFRKFSFFQKMCS